MRVTLNHVACLIVLILLTLFFGFIGFIIGFIVWIVNAMMVSNDIYKKENLQILRDMADKKA